jgi:DNA-binding IclR family transcriptional regulator
MPRTGRPATRHVAAVQRAVEVLNALGEARTELGTNEIARRTGVNVSSISRVLATLASGGLVDHVKSTGRYRLGLRLVQLANTAREGLDVRSLARPHLEELTELTGETATLSMPGTYEVITLDFAQSNLSVRSVAEVGRPSIAHATAVGKVFLAYGGTLPAGDLAAFTDRTITDRKVLDVEVERVRERGWGQAIGEREEDLNGIAVPILSRTNELVAILGIQGPANRFNPRAIRAAVDPLVEKAELIAAAL